MSTTSNSRSQLTLFVPEPQGSQIDALRDDLDPVQANLIAAHVTLCREDEFTAEEISKLLDRATRWAGGPLGLEFGKPRRFDGHGILMPCVDGSEDFHRLRQWILQVQDLRVHEPHLTLAHPRNPRSAKNDETALLSCPGTMKLMFTSLAFIRQRLGERWQICEVASLGGS